MRATCKPSLLLASLLLGHANSFAPTAGLQVRHRMPVCQSAPFAMTPRSRSAVATASALPQTAAPSFPRFGAVTRLLMMLVTALASICFRAGRALAVERTARAAAAPALSLVSGDVLKWGGLATLLGAAFVFRTEEKPILTETPMGENEQPAPSSMFDGIDGFEEVPDADGLTPAAPTLSSADDASLNSALFARMQQLANDGEATDEEESTAPPVDSTEGWGEGSTAVLERPDSDEPKPERGLLDGEAAVDFPPGFPIVDAEWDTQPAASEDQIAMLNRMLGKE